MPSTQAAVLLATLRSPFCFDSMKVQARLLIWNEGSREAPNLESVRVSITISGFRRIDMGWDGVGAIDQVFDLIFQIKNFPIFWSNSKVAFRRPPSNFSIRGPSTSVTESINIQSLPALVGPIVHLKSQ
jgi:hypothetical protein